MVDSPLFITYTIIVINIFFCQGLSVRVVPGFKTVFKGVSPKGGGLESHELLLCLRVFD
jgi:hypothetical protein